MMPNKLRFTVLAILIGGLGTMALSQDNIRTTEMRVGGRWSCWAEKLRCLFTMLEVS